jgi:hypothetical protein
MGFIRSVEVIPVYSGTHRPRGWVLVYDLGRLEMWMMAGWCVCVCAGVGVGASWRATRDPGPRASLGLCQQFKRSKRRHSNCVKAFVLIKPMSEGTESQRWGRVGGHGDDSVAATEW